MKPEDHNSDSRPHDRLRIVFVTERFWPLSGPTEINVGELATELNRQGHSIHIVTSKQERTWPSLLDYREIPVKRIAKGSGGPWANFRYARRFGNYFSETDHLNAILIFGISIVTYSILRAVGKKTPVVVFVNRSLIGAESVEQIPKRYIDVLRRCRAVATDCPVLAEELSQHKGMPHIHVVAPGAATAPQTPSLSSQSGARASLSEAHPILGVDAGQPLAITSLTNNNDEGILDAVKAWATIVQQHPKAKLWVVGEGRLASQVWQQIVDLNLIQSIIMPGCFDEDDGLLLAADLYLHTCRTPRADAWLIRAMAKQRCVLATRNRWTESFLESGENGLLAPAGNPAALAEAILLGFDKPDLRSRLASQGEKTAELHFSLAQQSRRFLKLLRLPTDQPCETTS